MSYTTLTVWNPVLPLATQDQIQAQAQTMSEQGKTDGTKTVVPVAAGMQVARTWTTLADAEEWLVYVEQFNPISVEILSPTT